ncbi:MAG: hypothetical protein D3908_06315 [Candidatus Electrothrix sp. AUS4]|nr:hypothetical protein [Candidatus Electrothrix sp. AUS4]
MESISNILKAVFFLLLFALCLGGVTVSLAYADCTESLILTVPEIVSAGSSNPISVSGGEAPYTWSACGKGYSVASEQTSDGSNTLNASTEIGCSYATVTVKDSCGQNAEIYFEKIDVK